jgi:hypothetical protein
VTRASRELRLGAIRPRGWILDQLLLQADGITGRLEDVWPDVGPDSGWLGGDGEDWERGPYYLDGLVPLAWLLDDPRLIARARPWIEWILSSQDETGFFGPVANRDWWPRMVVVKALEQYADATEDARVVPFLEAYFAFQLRELPRVPLASWARVRGADNTLGVWWLYERTGDDGLLALIDLLIEQTTDWDDYLGCRLVTGPARVFRHVTHGPNVAMGLKTGAVTALRDDSDAARDAHRSATERSFANLDRWHGQAHGFFSGDEWLGGRDATAGVETCQVVELMYTLERLAQLYGDGVYGDRLEALAFNLLAASSDPRMLGHQYHQQANQVSVSVARRPWTHSSDDANVFGLEPHFGCCTANLHQGWPKLVRSSWVVDADGGLRVVTYLPGTVEARLGGQDLRIAVETDYPFDETITLVVSVAPDRTARGPIRVRIPGWASEATLTLGGEALPVDAVDGYVTLDRTWRDGDRVVLTLPMHPRVERREGQSAVVRLGPLTMSLRIGENWSEVPGAPGIGEWEIHPRSSWNFGLADVDGASGWRVDRRRPGPIPFSLDAAPVTIATRGAHVHAWELEGAQAGPVPSGPVRDVGPVLDIALVPYGSARLRITEFPVIAIGSVDESEE